MTPLAIAFVIVVASSFLKKVALPKVGKLGVQVIVFVCALLGAAYYNYGNLFPGVQVFVMQALSLFSLAVAFYEVIFSRLNIFQRQDNSTS